jgi:hypothetical protein
MNKEAFMEKVSPEPMSGCWLWTGSSNGNGYGVMRINNKQQGAHRVAFELFVGPIPPGLMICHKCDNPPCVNPHHLFAGTALDNNRDMFAKGRARTNTLINLAKTHCPKGHPYSGENLYLKKDGHRECNKCARLRSRASYHRKKARNFDGSAHAKTHCPHGHPYSEENLYRTRDGRQACRECCRVRDRARYHRKAQMKSKDLTTPARPQQERV